jgi:hypothetical protein
MAGLFSDDSSPATGEGEERGATPRLSVRGDLAGTWFCLVCTAVALASVSIDDGTLNIRK